jgi:hypothetical protein
VPYARSDQNLQFNGQLNVCALLILLRKNDCGCVTWRIGAQKVAAKWGSMAKDASPAFYDQSS